MTEKTIIIGFGRAGKRHAKELQKRNIAYAVVEPAAVQPGPGVDHYRQLNQVPWREFTTAIIATPPTLHPEQIFACLSNGLAVLCEKPLCDIGQLDLFTNLLLDDPVMVAYNYRNHPELQKAVAAGKSPNFLFCSQYRSDLPPWGLLLDHCSHDLDIARMFGKTDVQGAKYTIRPTGERWFIELDSMHVSETVFWEGLPQRVARLYFDDTVLDIDAPPEMYGTMYDLFYMRYFGDSLEQSLVTQEMLEVAFEMG